MGESKARAYAEKLIAELRGRKGLRHEWDYIDDGIQEEITEAWAAIFAEAIADERAAIEPIVEALQQIDQWAKAYPLAMFPEPDLDLVKEILAERGQQNQIDRMHASWARHIVEGIGKIAADAIESASHLPGREG